MLIKVAGIMAKTDSFFIRQTVSTTGTTFTQETIDLGAFVDALGRSILKVKSIAVQYADATDVNVPLNMAANAMNKISWQLTTQSQSALIYADDRSLVSSGSITFSNALTGDKVSMITETNDLNPQMWDGGYLVGVDALYLGCDAYAALPTGEVNVTIVMECVSETLSKEAAMALALSQQ
jgi:hypothetical protein